MLVTDDRFSEQATAFWSDRGDFIKEQYDRMKEVYDTPENGMMLFYTVNKEKREIWYHGYSIEGFPVSTVAKKVGKQVFACTYEHFLRVKNGFPPVEATNYAPKNRNNANKQTETANENDSLVNTTSEDAEKEQELSGDVMGIEGRSSVLRMQIQNFLDAYSFEEMLHFMKGKDTNDIVREVYEQGDKSGIGIIFMDEFDKKLIPSYTSGGNDVNAAVQAQILTLIEGRKVDFKEGSLDTNNTLFIGLGSFDECRKRRETKKGGLGFGSFASATESDHYHAISRDEMIDLGASYELLGRFQILANYYRLSEDAVEGLIQRFVEKTSDSIGVTVKITPEMKEELHTLANGQYGCRMLENTITDRAMELLPELLMKKEGKRYYSMVLDSDGKSRIEARRILEEDR